MVHQHTLKHRHRGDLCDQRRINMDSHVSGRRRGVVRKRGASVCSADDQSERPALAPNEPGTPNLKEYEQNLRTGDTAGR